MLTQVLPMLALLVQSAAVLGDAGGVQALADALLEPGTHPYTCLSEVRLPVSDPDLLLAFMMGAALEEDLAGR
jgi:hypothetical protein